MAIGSLMEDNLEHCTECAWECTVLGRLLLVNTAANWLYAADRYVSGQGRAGGRGSGYNLMKMYCRVKIMKERYDCITVHAVRVLWHIDILIRQHTCTHPRHDLFEIHYRLMVRYYLTSHGYKHSQQPSTHTWMHKL